MNVVILGSGGTAKTAWYVAQKLGAAGLTTVSRGKKGDGFCGYDEIDFENTDFVINCTPVGMYPNENGMPVDPKRFLHLLGAVDVIYNPPRTAFIIECEKEKIPCTNGMKMLVAQGIYAERLFGNRNAEIRKCDEIASMLSKELLNIVLVGMPSCGKTCVGKEIAARLGMRFFDTDAEIERYEGRKISEIFRGNGEKHFRDAEKRVIAEICKGARNCVIATGGGVVLDDKNVDTLKRSGVMVYINRSIDLLTATDGRPLASDRKKLEKIYAERKDIYPSVCDIEVDGNGNVGQTADLIIGKLK